MREGSVKVRIDGRGMERFFNIAAQREIEIWDIETEKERRSAEENGPCTLRSCLGILNT